MSRDNDPLSPSVLLTEESLKIQRGKNRLDQDKLGLDRLALEISGKVAKTQRTYATSAVIAAIAAVIAAATGIANLIISSMK